MLRDEAKKLIRKMRKAHKNGVKAFGRTDIDQLRHECERTGYHPTLATDDPSEVMKVVEQLEKADVRVEQARQEIETTAPDEPQPDPTETPVDALNLPTNIRRSLKSYAIDTAEAIERYRVENDLKSIPNISHSGVNKIDRALSEWRASRDEENAQPTGPEGVPEPASAE